jgi:transposase-like protein
MNKSEFKVGNKYIITKEDTGAIPDYNAIGVILTGKHDDGTDNPEFYLPEGMRDDFGDNWIYLGVSFVEPYVEPKVTKPKTTKASKPRIKTLTSGRRQFDVAFKLMIIRTANSFSGTRTGKVAALLAKYSLDKGHLKYWRKQFNQGHFSPERAVAFSRKDTMVHG